ncbi:hypothetical protein CEW46_24695 [Bacillus cereus]|nr:hypothetical protein CEW46_24695 [Bacillus cereus]
MFRKTESIKFKDFMDGTYKSKSKKPSYKLFSAIPIPVLFPSILVSAPSGGILPKLSFDKVRQIIEPLDSVFQFIISPAGGYIVILGVGAVVLGSIFLERKLENAGRGDIAFALSSATSIATSGLALTAATYFLIKVISMFI